MRPNELIDAVRRTLEDSGYLSSSITVVPYEVARNSEDANIKLPIVEIQPLQELRLRNFNTDRVEYKYDDNGNRIGRIFESEYRLDLQIDVYTAAKSGYDARSIGTDVWQTLYQHDSAGPDQPFLDGNGDPIDKIWNTRIEDGEPANELETTPTLRRWRMDVSLWSVNEFDTTEDYIEEYRIRTDVNNDDTFDYEDTQT